MDDFNKAETLATADKKDKVYVYLYRGIDYCVLGEFDKAIADLDKALVKALKRKPARAEGFFYRGNAHYGKGDYAAAIVDYTAALEIRPDFYEALNNRGVAYSGKGEYDKAIADFNKALSIKNCDHKILNNRGTVYYHWSQYDKAITDFTDALAIKPDFHEALCNRGNAYRHKGESDYTDALAVKPKLLESLNGRGLSYYCKGDYEAAIADFNAALNIKPDLAVAKDNRAAALAAKNAKDVWRQPPRPAIIRRHISGLQPDKNPRQSDKILYKPASDSHESGSDFSQSGSN